MTFPWMAHSLMPLQDLSVTTPMVNKALISRSLKSSGIQMKILMLAKALTENQN